MTQTVKSIQDIQIECILKGLNNQQTLDVVLQSHPNANTSKYCVSWYRSKIKKDPKYIKIAERIREASSQLSLDI